MPKVLGRLTDVQVRKVKPAEKLFKLADGGGLFLWVQPNGSKLWRFRFIFDAKEQSLSLGAYPDVTLARAREEASKARAKLAEGVSPAKQRQAEKAAAQFASEGTFEFVAREWHAKNASAWVESHSGRILARLEANAFPWIGPRPVGEIKAPELLAVLRRIEARGAVETAHRTLAVCGQVFRYAVATGRAERDISSDLRGALTPAKGEHFASITEPKAIGGLLRAIADYRGSFVTKCALQLAPLVFVRPGELRAAEWSEIDFERAEWRIRAERMKMRETHIVPLANQALAILRELHPLTGSGRYVFPSARTAERPMSNNAVLSALRRMGFEKSEMTGHGFRSMASTLLNEHGWHRDAIERQLAHAERDSVRAAYNYAEHLPERRRMMQAWADYLGQLARGAEVIALPGPRAA